MNLILTDLEGTLTTGSSWRGYRTYFKGHYSARKYNLFFARFLPRFPLMKMGLLNRQKTMTTCCAPKEISCLNSNSTSSTALRS